LTKCEIYEKIDTSFNFESWLIMSTTERYGTEVWRGLLSVTINLANQYIQWATVGEVARAAGVSRGTAKKYLEMLIEKGDVKSMKFGNRTGYAVITGMEE
jgi:response regulator of citrate/malate metabolism